MWTPGAPPETEELTPGQMSALNDALFAKLTSNDAESLQKAVDAVNDFMRMKMREDGFHRRIMPPLPISNEELDRPSSHLWTPDQDESGLIEEAPAAIAIPFATLPLNLSIKGPKYQGSFDLAKQPSFQAQEPAMLKPEQELAVQAAQTKTQAATSEEERRLAAAFWRRCNRRYRRRISR